MKLLPSGRAEYVDSSGMGALCHRGGVPVADTIICVDCGGSCQRIPDEPPELGWQPGDVVVYRCRDCADAWYVEVDEDDLD